MVNADRVRRKLPSLLVDGATTDKKQWAERAKISYRLTQYRRRNPQKYNSLAFKLIMVLESFKREISKQK